jgi:hypothetical protein
MKALRILTIAVTLGTLLTSAGLFAQDTTKPNPLDLEALVLTPPASAAPQGSWSYVASRGYLWVPVTPSGMMEAEWAPWDPWWVMPYGQWAWAEGCGWGWTPMIPYHSMSPLGWGFDSWYGGWYGFTPDGNPSNTLWSYRFSTPDKPMPIPGGGNHVGNPKAKGHRPEVATLVAAPPPSLAPPTWKAAPGSGSILNERSGQDHRYHSRPNKQGAHPSGGQGTGGSHVGPGRGGPPTSGGNGGGSAAPPSSSGHSRRR